MKKRLYVALALVSLAVLPGRAQDFQGPDIRFSNPALRILQSYTLHPNETASGVLVIANDATIAGHVEGDVLVILGQAQLASTAVIDGSFVVIGGNGVIADGAQVHRDVFVIGGLETPQAFNPGGSQVVIGAAPLGNGLRGLVPWLTRGLLFGRLIVPDLTWVWTVAAVFFFLNLLLNLMFDGPVRASTTALQTTPVSAFLTGLLVMLLAGPLCALLAISVIGIVVIPFFAVALVLGSVIGRIAFARWLGSSLFPQADPASRGQSLRSFLIGSAVMCVAYLIPVLGLVTWAMAAVFGLGASSQAFARAYRRENPRKPRKAAIAPAAAVAAPAAPAARATSVFDTRTDGEAAVAEPVEPASTSEPAPAAPVDASFVERDAAEGAFDLPEPPPARAPGLLGFPRATFAERLAALCLDFVLVAIVSQVLRLDRLFSYYPASENNLFLLALVYHIGFWTWKQTTIGGIICELRLVRTDGAPLRFPDALIRGLSGIFSLIVVGLGFLWILRDPERQAWHDRIAGTYVVKVPRDWGR
jgi:uncharacterized RDD family membrane protein YckC